MTAEPTTAPAAVTDAQAGVHFAADEQGRRSTSVVGRAVLARALAAAGPDGAAPGTSGPWRTSYLDAFRRATLANAGSRDSALRVARAGLAEVDAQMVSVDGGVEVPATALLERPASERLGTTSIAGGAPADRSLVVPYDGQQLSGDLLRRQLDAWVDAGVMTTSAREQIGAVLDNPDWLRLDGRTVVALGAAAEMAPVGPLLRWGATVAAVDVPRAEPWARLRALAALGAGSLLMPERTGGSGRRADVPGVDLLGEVPSVAQWLAQLPGQLVLGNYTYADSGTHVRVSVAADLLARRVLAARPDTALAYLATPTDAFVVPAEAYERSAARQASRGPVRRLGSTALHATSRGRLLNPAYVGAAPQVCDALVPVQGPNYALAKRIQRWRASVARDEGVSVSLHVAPASRTRSVMKNRVLRTVYAGAHRFGVEVFDPATSNALMAALLVHDLHVTPPRQELLWQEEAAGAVHGGLWTTAYEPRSALGLAAVLGLGTRPARQSGAA